MSFAYSFPNAPPLPPVLHDVTLVLPAGSRCILVGANGAGKPSFCPAQGAREGARKPVLQSNPALEKSRDGERVGEQLGRARLGEGLRITVRCRPQAAGGVRWGRRDWVEGGVVSPMASCDVQDRDFPERAQEDLSADLLPPFLSPPGKSTLLQILAGKRLTRSGAKVLGQDVFFSTPKGVTYLGKAPLFLRWELE